MMTNETAQSPDNPFLLTGNSLKKAIAFLKRKRIIIFIAAFLGLAFGIFYSLVKKPIYTANISFALEEEDKMGGGGILNLASQFGFDLGGNQSDLFTGDNIIELFKSRRIIESTLVGTYDSGQKKTFAEVFLDVSGIRRNAGLPPDFFRTTNVENFSRLQDSIMGLLCETITKAYLTVDKPDKKLDIYDATFKSTDEEFTKRFTEELVSQVSQFYIITKTKKAKQNVDILQNKVDSIRNAYTEALHGKAILTDANINPALQGPFVNIQERETDITVLGTAYTELLKNLELAKYSLLRQTPLIQIIDTPILPLEKKTYSVWEYSILGIFGFVVLTTFFLIIFKLFRIMFRTYLA